VPTLNRHAGPIVAAEMDQSLTGGVTEYERALNALTAPTTITTTSTHGVQETEENAVLE
jgi:hypothetical protein